jgi:tetratricopeptide (TPR) repeat protein
MSLLLDALKKAELAKQIAKAESPTPEQAGAEPAPLEPAPRVITREKLPEITQPLEILTDDLPSEQKAPEAPKARPELSLQEAEAFAPAAPPPLRTGVPPHPEGRAQAEQLFQVKEMDYNPHRPFYLTLGALGLLAVGYGGYVWWQMQPHYSVPPLAAQPSAPAVPVQVATAPASAQAPSPPPSSGAPAQTPPGAAAPASARVAVIPPIQPVRPRQRSPQAFGASAPGAAATRAELSPAPAAPVPGQAGGPPIAVNVPVMTVDPQVEHGYQAFQKNDLAAARESYQKALAREPRNRDALLGLAAIDVRSGELEAAESRYMKLLEMDPRDGQAVAGLVSLRGRFDPVASESRLKTLIAGQPDVAQLHFSLGNQYAQQSRWTEAQAAYFRAYSIDPQNADYAFNLAVSLDQMRQRKPALEYYQRAIALATKRAASFDSAQARLRVEELSKLPAP